MRIFALIVALICTRGSSVRADAPPSAESLYAEGQAAYDKADYAVAIAKWQESYQLSGESGLLFNLAQARRLSGNCTEALATYEKFLAADHDPASDQHKLADDFKRELAPTCGAHQAPVLDPKPSLNLWVSAHEKHDGRRGRSLRLAGIAAGGTGIAVIAAGLALGHHGQTLGNDVSAACAISCDWAVQKGKDAAGRADVAIGYALDAVGAAAIAGGAVTYYLGTRGSGLTITPRPSEGGAMISWSGSW